MCWFAKIYPSKVIHPGIYSALWITSAEESAVEMRGRVFEEDGEEYGEVRGRIKGNGLRAKWYIHGKSSIRNESLVGREKGWSVKTDGGRDGNRQMWLNGKVEVAKGLIAEVRIRIRCQLGIKPRGLTDNL
ncbi:uncharacterized protein MELLADRAFT_105972 [Melampsora larici-populina 98AG31]|uniref:Uncharacterized protein n=1 Tax=Melampsora larici-populina (strain 98AG31 / pathotype 3-4-7) TaxID=747676 RepID=F4RJY2_MELLP|nr:uncharacterized protein MELLADRAFT_105972 [Melampsora larici-populina 98AG31]EGG07415.1 hypothetical protein MELLADRAFT_105972 [Melampsora larici-populina 98AG31]